MRSTFKTVFYVNGSKERNGIVPIMGRVTINGTIAQFSCKLSVTKAIWDAKGNRAKGRSKEANEVNFALDNIKAQIAKHYQRLSDREAFVTAEMVRNAYQGIGTEYETLLRAFDKENAAFAQRVGKDRAVTFWSMSYDQYFWYIFFMRMKGLIVILLLGTVFGRRIVTRVFLALFLFLTGIFITMSVIEQGLSGIAAVLLAMLPQWIFYLLAFTVYERGRERKVIFVCALLVVLGCLAEGYISPFFLKKVL